MKRPVIIDCDPGIDDATAIMLMQASGAFDIRGITAVHGNVPLHHTMNNALFLSELYGIGCPVAIGAERAMISELPKAQTVHGTNGLGDFRYERPNRTFYERPAWDFIWETAVEANGALELFAIGPLTNIAIAVLKYPRLPELVKQLVIMGGAAHAGNATPFAEFNIWQDPHAASVVLDAGFKRVTMVDLDCCNTGYLTDAEADRMMIVNNRLRPLFERMRQFQRRAHKENAAGVAAEEFREDKNIFYDAVAAAILIDPDIAVFEPCYAVVETESAANFGQTVFDWNSRFNRPPNLQLARSIDREAFVGRLFGSFDFYSDNRLEVDADV